MIISKQKIADILRKAHLLQVADYLMFVRNVSRNKKTNQRFLAQNPNFIHPPADLAYDAYNHTNWQSYNEMGQKHSALIAQLIREYVAEKQINVCEWGCGPARVIQHLTKIDGFERVDLVGTDYNGKTIRWCSENIQNIQFLQNNLEPPLPLSAELFDCVYAISIFTHLSEKSHFLWINELFRVLKPNGILIFTTHGNLCAQRLLPDEKQKYDSGILITKSGVKEGKKHFAAYHPPVFIKNTLLKDYIVIKHIENTAQYGLDQDVWVAKKPA